MVRKMSALFAALLLAMSLMTALVGAAAADNHLPPLPNDNWYYVAGPIEGGDPYQEPCEFNQGGQRSGERTVTPAQTQTFLAYNPGGQNVEDRNATVVITEEQVGPCANVPGPQPRN